MPIVTIYQGASGSGQEVAEAVAKELDYRCISREVLVEASRKYGIPQAKLKENCRKRSAVVRAFTANPHAVPDRSPGGVLRARAR